ncbi:unnamed protein product [Sphagnum balticum]
MKLENIEIKYEHIEPLAHYMLIEPIEKSSTTSSGIVLPDNDEKMPMLGKIVKIGPDVSKLNHAVGDIISYRKYSQEDVRFTNSGKEVSFCLVRENGSPLDVDEHIIFKLNFSPEELARIAESNESQS